jgi:hypothetical protein
MGRRVTGERATGRSLHTLDRAQAGLARELGGR